MKIIWVKFLNELSRLQMNKLENINEQITESDGIFKMSDSINEIALALSNVQGELEDVHKDSQGYGYTYADLSAIFRAIRPLLKKHGLSLAQPVGGKNGQTSLFTVLMHSSGQYMYAVYNISADLSNKKMNLYQAAGSAITYLRRYCASSMIGIATKDDDAASADSFKLELKLALLDALGSGLLTKEHIDKALIHYGVKTIGELTAQQLQSIIARINKG